MTPIGPVASASDSVAEHALKRSYPFTLLPTQKQQTFTTPTITLTPPFVRFVQGATNESNKLYEAAVENADSLIGLFFPVGPNSTPCYNYTFAFDCYMYSNSSTSLYLDNESFIGIELFSQSQAPLTNTPNTGCVHLRQNLKDLTKWILSVYLGGGIAGIHVPFTIPPSQSVGGHKVRLLWNPYEFTVSAYVDDVLRAKQSIAGFQFNTPDVVAGILLSHSLLSLSPQMFAHWMGANVTTYGLHTAGAGAF